MTNLAQLGSRVPHGALGARLKIELHREWPAPRAGDELLVGFHFGRQRPITALQGLVSTGIDPIEADDLYECWWYPGKVEHDVHGRVRVAHCDDFAAVTVQAPDAGPDEFRALTYDVYMELLAAVRRAGHPHVVRIWNYFSNINVGEGDDEKYRQFSCGRADAYEKFGVSDEVVPAATAIGSARDSDFSVIALTSKHEFRNVENPRQVSAYRYPREYGPKSPKFSRGGCVNIGDRRLLLVSGTASIIGHESVHEGNVEMQCEETLVNLRKLCETLGETAGVAAQLVLDQDSVVRVYIRDKADAGLIAARVQEFLGGRADGVALLNADICRRELQLEIDASKFLMAAE